MARLNGVLLLVCALVVVLAIGEVHSTFGYRRYGYRYPVSYAYPVVYSYPVYHAPYYYAPYHYAPYGYWLKK